MATIEDKDFWDLRDLAELARECGAELEDEDTDEEDAQESRETLAKLSNLAAELGHTSDEEDAESVADALEDAMGSFGPTLISEDYFTEYCQELVSDIGDLPSELPAYLANNINWDGVADDLKVDYTSVTLDGVDYYIR